MKLKEHTRNQKRMYRIHKQDEKIHDLELMIGKLQQESKQLKNNWNKLKEYIGSEWYCFDNESVEFEVAKSILNKMQELEQGSGNNDTSK